MHPCLMTLAGVVLGSSLGVLATSASADGSISTGFVFEMLGLQHCESLPDDVSAEVIEHSLAESAASGVMPLNATLVGIMTGDRMGMTLFGTRAEETSLATVSSIWGPVEGLGYRTLCLAMLQLGDQPVVPGTFRIVGSQGMADANPGDVLAVATLATLSDSGNKTAEGRPIYREGTLGEGRITGGLFIIESFDGTALTARFELEGTFALDEEAPGVAFTLQGTTIGERGLARVPSLTASP